MQEQDTGVELRYMKQDYIVAQRLHYLSWTKWHLGLLVISLVPFIAFLSPRSLAWSPTSWASWLLWMAISWSPFFLFFSLFQLCVFWLYVPFRAARSFEKDPTAQLPQHVTLAPEGIRYESDRGAFTLLWQDFIKWRVNSKLIVAYLSPQKLMIYPIRLATAGFPIDRLKEKLTQQLGPPKR